MKTEHVKYFLMFCCPPRSGHTLVASILNAHPNVVCSNQQFIMNQISSSDIELRLAKINMLSQIESGTHRSKWNPNAYIEPLPKEDITVIGDKTGHRTIKHLISFPEDLEVFKRTVKWPIKWIHVVRNPFDNLATWTKKNYESRKLKANIGTEFDIAFGMYKGLNDKIRELKKTEDVLTINHERVIRFIDKTLDELCLFLDIEKNSEWRSRVVKQLWKEPRITRKDIKWSQQDRIRSFKLTKKYPWLKGYDFGG